MLNKLRTTLGGAGFYGVLFLSLAIVGTGAYFLLFHDGTGAPSPDSSAETTVIAELPQAHETPAPPVVETVRPETLPDADSTPVPEDNEDVPAVDTAPVIPEAPSLVVSPLSGQVVAAFSADALAYNETLDDWRTHDGVDIAAAAGTNVLAASAGTVLSVEQDDLMGTTVVLEHSGGYETTYANLQKQPAVQKGDKVSAGQVIGAVGTTALSESAEGPHLHFSVVQNGLAVNPDEYLNR